VEVHSSWKWKKFRKGGREYDKIEYLQDSDNLLDRSINPELNSLPGGMDESLHQTKDLVYRHE
jgi:hypothetical protein